ncbi:hypothetical protein NC652_029314 [Populus alba x Populus x berolinensis]|nr:hypothetical protein NC652_029314 [Populus alba x Populus x berolinensis]
MVCLFHSQTTLFKGIVPSSLHPRKQPHSSTNLNNNTVYYVSVFHIAHCLYRLASSHSATQSLFFFHCFSCPPLHYSKTFFEIYSLSAPLFF